MTDIKLEIEDYHGNTIIDLPYFDFADKESDENHYRFQAEHMEQKYNVEIIRTALKKALKQLERWG